MAQPADARAPVTPPPAATNSSNLTEPGQSIGTERSKPRDSWDKADIIGKLLGAILIPIALAIAGFAVNIALQNRSAQQKTAEIAVTILQSKDAGTPALRAWAQTVFNDMLAQANQKLPPGAEQELRTNPLPSSTPPTVLGGTPSSLADWPWLVSVYASGRFFCNGTLIAPRMVLTTAFCVNYREPADYEVRTVIDDGTEHLRTDRRIPVVKTYIHPAFSNNELGNDIAILELDQDLPPPFATISVQDISDPSPGTLTLVAALGPEGLRQVAIPVVDNRECAPLYGDKFTSKGTMCAGFEHGGAAACPGSGSAGGPLVLFSNTGRKYQVGIVSIAQKCSVSKPVYGGYTRISFYADWIRRLVPNVLSAPTTKVNR
jgi:Trypsin